MAPDSLTAETLVTHTNDCTLTVQVTPTAESLHLQYHVRNTSPRPLYLLNQLWENAWRNTTRNQLIFYTLPNLVNVEASAEAVTVSKKVVDVPPGLLVEARRIPLMTRVAPGDEHTETVILALPLQLNNLYQSGPLNVPSVSRPLYFELGYLPSEPTEAAIREVATPKGSAFGTDAFPASEQAIIAVGPFGQSVQVLADERSTPAPRKDQWTPWG